MEENQDFVYVKVYGVMRHCNFMEMRFPEYKMVTGEIISIEGHSYKVVSIVETGANQYAVNVMSQEYD
ncbi:MAG: hypothetical protein HQM14_15270 [SAR324 cluster bacterium]|nr:hypothetical protein [SAR324 cluster bacterium]